MYWVIYRFIYTFNQVVCSELCFCRCYKSCILGCLQWATTGASCSRVRYPARSFRVAIFKAILQFCPHSLYRVVFWAIGNIKDRGYIVFYEKILKNQAVMNSKVVHQNNEFRSHWSWKKREETVNDGKASLDFGYIWKPSIPRSADTWATIAIAGEDVNFSSIVTFAFLGALPLLVRVDVVNIASSVKISLRQSLTALLTASFMTSIA